ncbi:MAG: c-type cytochrome [Sulfuriferula sp.]
MALAIKFLKYAEIILSFVLITPVFAASLTPQSVDDSVRQGRYVAQLGDCVACHTAPGGKPLAGGLELNTPFGIIHSTNITPDVKTGIGSYSYTQFARAMRQGIAADGHNLYPAMPYPSFAKISEPDMHVLYAYLMRGVAPVKQANKENDMQWPFSMRIGLTFWNKAFLDDQPYKPNPAKSVQWNRGAYLIEGMGHCGSCHTPRGVAFQEKAMNQDGPDGKYFLAGSTVEAWRAVGLRDLWTAPEITQFLKSGQNSHAAAYGSMTEVIHFSTQFFTDSDLAAMAEYLKSLSPSAESISIGQKPTVSAQVTAAELYKTSGGLGYTQFCSTCHQLDGHGVTDIFPPLAKNSSVQSKDPASVIHVVLSGWKSAVTQHSPRSFGMPNFSSLSDQELAEIVTFVRTKWGNQGDPVSADQVEKIRAEIKLKPVQPSAFATPRFAAMLNSPHAEQLIYGMRLVTETKVLLPHNVGNSLNCTSCHLNGGTVANGSPFVGLAATFPIYAPRAGRTIDFKDRINACFKRSMNGKPLARNSRELEAMVAYSAWMQSNTKPRAPIPGRGVGKISKSIIPNLSHGKQIYQNQCAVCHGANGEGIKAANGTYIFPPLWGNESFNIGAGMARTYTAAAFAKNNMPMANTLSFPLGQGGLTAQEAVDVGEYFSHMPRPDFTDKGKDWPNGGKPKDGRY